MNKHFSGVQQLLIFIIKNRISIAWYLLIGVVTFLIYVACFSLCLERLHLHYKIAVSIAYLVAVLFHFISNRALTFKSAGNNLCSHVVKYTGMLIIGYALTLSVMHLIVSILLLSPYIGIILAPGVTLVSNYLLSHFWVFKKSAPLASSEIGSRYKCQ